jgi:hypothetical protein
MAWARVIYCAVARGWSVRKWGILDVLAISGDCPIMWSILGAFWHGMLKFLKGILHSARHGQVHMFVLIIPFQSDAIAKSTCPIF